jgi:hypothetical protein
MVDIFPFRPSVFADAAFFASAMPRRERMTRHAAAEARCLPFIDFRFILRY